MTYLIEWLGIILLITGVVTNVEAKHDERKGIQWLGFVLVGAGTIVVLHV